MLTEPNIDKLSIQNIIQQSYGLKVAMLSFMKGGEASWGYKIETENGQVYFCKIHTGLTDHKKRFELTYKLFNVCGIKNITHPVKNLKGELVVYIDKYPTALFNFISGANSFDRPLNEKQRFDLGVLIGKIHKANQIIGDFGIKEDFKYGNIQRLLETLEKAEKYKSDSSRFKTQTAELLVENENKIQKRINELEILGEQLRNQDINFVICHSEPHLWNTMINDEGEVFLIDWDDCLFAPKEKDLNFIKDDPFKLEGYESEIGKLMINQEIIRYYQLEWNISEIDAWSASLLYEDSNDTQNQHFLEQFKKDLAELA